METRWIVWARTPSDMTWRPYRDGRVFRQEHLAHRLADRCKDRWPHWDVEVRSAQGLKEK